MEYKFYANFMIIWLNMIFCTYENEFLKKEVKAYKKIHVRKLFLNDVIYEMFSFYVVVSSSGGRVHRTSDIDLLHSCILVCQAIYG